MATTAFRIYAWITGGVAMLGLVYLDWETVYQIPRLGWIAFASLVVMGLISEYLALRIDFGKSGGTSSITFILVFASVLLLGPEATVLFAGGSWFISQFVVRRKELPKATFNVAQIILSALVAGWCFEQLGGQASLEVLSFDITPFIVSSAAFVVVNLVLVTGGLSLIQGAPFGEMIHRIAGPKGLHVFYDLLVSPVALLVAVLFIEFQVWGLLGITVTLFFIRRSYLTNYQLQDAMRDLLFVLVKAIETRDPYTSGHSLRVRSLAGRIASELGLPAHRVEEIQTAALLHDIGKIDEVYTELLKKPAALSDKEREIIESHAAKGAELLHSLSSVSDNVILAVRHHHERIDGKGYPDGIAGSAIPLGARIIKVCDAIDAMLSDRPYRRALALDQVKEQLVMFTGKQFDVEVVSVVVNSSLLEDHAAELAFHRLQQSSSAEVEPLFTTQSRAANRTVVRS